MAVEQRPGVRPRRVEMRVVGLDHEVAGADAVDLQERRRVVDGAEPEVPPQYLRGGQVDPCPRAVELVVAQDVVEPGADPRSGRWAGTGKTECGLHT